MARTRRQSPKPKSEPPADPADYRGRPVEYCTECLGVELTPTQEKIAGLLVQPPYKVLVRAGHNVGIY